MATSNLKTSDQSSELRSAKPFIKWAGGKRRLCGFLGSLVPETWNNYLEPMMGGAALFFYLNPEKAFLADSNPDLVDTYQTVKDHPLELIESLKKHKNEEDYYYSLRDADRQSDFNSWSKVEKASRLIFLNRTCYNGLFRVNKKGFFNVPYGKYESPFQVREDEILSASESLQVAKIECRSFLEVERVAMEEDFVYFDPPYLPLSSTSSFTSYTREPFLINEQVALKNLVETLTEKGVKVMVSNSNNEFIRSLYSDFQIHEVHAARAINSKANGRGKILELVITNYK